MFILYIRIWVTWLQIHDYHIIQPVKFLTIKSVITKSRYHRLKLNGKKREKKKIHDYLRITEFIHDRWVLKMAFGWYLWCEDEDRRTVWDYKALSGACSRSKQWSGYCHQASWAHQGAVSHFVLCRLLPGRYHTSQLN